MFDLVSTGNNNDDVFSFFCILISQNKLFYDKYMVSVFKCDIYYKFIIIYRSVETRKDNKLFF